MLSDILRKDQNSAFTKENRVDLLEIIKTISDGELQIKVLNSALFENSPLNDFFKFPGYLSLTSTLKNYRNQLVVECKHAINGAMVFSQAYHQNVQAWNRLQQGILVKKLEENSFYPLAEETFLHVVGFFSATRLFQKTFNKCFNSHPRSSLWPSSSMLAKQLPSPGNSSEATTHTRDPKKGIN